MNAFTLDELIFELQNLRKEVGGDIKVHYSHEYGDYINTIIAPGVEDVYIGNIKDSSYHNAPMVVNEDDEEKGETVIIIR